MVLTDANGAPVSSRDAERRPRHSTRFAAAAPSIGGYGAGRGAAEETGADLARPPCHFYLLGKCRFGATCTFSHTARAAETVCKFYMEQGSCRYGNKCVFLHPPREGAAPASAPAATAAASSLAVAAAARAPTAATAASSDDDEDDEGAAYAFEYSYRSQPAAALSDPERKPPAEAAAAAAAAGVASAAAEDEGPNELCGVCFDSVPRSGKRFGLLTGCDHVFCLDCIKSWRQSTTVEKGVSRSCPSCRRLSHFVVPSKVHCEGEAKARVIENYKKTLAVLPCRYFKPPAEGRPGTSCPFGASCFYAHFNMDGVDVKGLPGVEGGARRCRCAGRHGGGGGRGGGFGGGGGRRSGGGRGGGGLVVTSSAEYGSLRGFQRLVQNLILEDDEALALLFEDMDPFNLDDLDIDLW